MKKAKLVRESLNEEKSWEEYQDRKLTFPAEYGQIRATAKQLEKKLRIVLKEIGPDDGDETSLDDEGNELACILFEVNDKKFKHIVDEELIIIIDALKRFQFYAGGQPIATTLHSEEDKRDMWAALNPVFISADLLTPEAYLGVVKEYKENDYYEE